jgi:GNAT superfamily N-acetyltransferase
MKTDAYSLARMEASEQAPVENPAAVVRAAAAAWRWVPYDALRVTTPAVDLVIAGHNARVHRASAPPGTDTAQFVAAVADLAARKGAASLTWIVGDGDPLPDLDAVLTARGSTVVQDLQVLARPLGTFAPSAGTTPAAEVRRVDTPDELDEAYAIDSAVLGTPVRSTRFRQVAADMLAAQVAEGPARTAYRFVALIDEVVVATAGLTLDGPIAKLWGAAVLPDHRGRGVYRALLDTRLAQAAKHRATIALAKARTDSSAPILQRAGFHAYGRERHHRLTEMTFMTTARPGSAPPPD